jgi:DNA-binding NtrC family response regulator
VDDEMAVRIPLERFFAARGFEVATASTLAEALESYKSAAADVVLLDYALPDGDGLELLRRLKALDPSVTAILLTAHGSIDLAVQAVKEGAENFLTKPVELPALLLMVERLAENRRLRHRSEVDRWRQASHAPDPFLGESAAVRRLADQAARVAAAPTPVLIRGETGSGKGVLARWLHDHGPRAPQAFVDLNCAGLSRELLESELFGHHKGAFTGAVANKMGLMEMAHRGTLFLDEMGDVDMQVQAKLLKALEEMRFRRLGDVQDRRVDVRMIVATHRDLDATASGASSSACRPCASAAATSSCSRRGSFSGSPRTSAGRGRGSPRRPRRCWSPIPGPATSASCATFWSTPCC